MEDLRRQAARDAMPRSGSRAASGPLSKGSGGGGAAAPAAGGGGRSAFPSSGSVGSRAAAAISMPRMSSTRGPSTDGGREKRSLLSRLGRGRAGDGAQYGSRGRAKYSRGAPVKAPAKGGKQAPKKAQGPREADDDDDSDAEILSISSDDDDGPAQDSGGSGPAALVAGGGPGVGPGGAGRKALPSGPSIGHGRPLLSRSSLLSASRRVYQDMDEGEDQNDAQTWDDVNEELLRRQVRSFRSSTPASVLGSETSVPSSAAQTSATAALHVDVSQLMKVVDPLGYGPLDMDKLCLTSRSGLMSPPPKNSRPEWIVGMEEAFDAQFFLSRVHLDTPVGDLKAGRQRVEQLLQLEQGALQQLVKGHFESFLLCRTTMGDVERNMETMGQEGTIDYLKGAIASVEQKAQNAFGDLLARQGQVDRIRSVQAVLQRFRTLFNLPGVVRSLARQKDYEGAVHEYLKARSINISGQSKILVKVQEEVERVVAEISQALYDQMTDPSADNGTVESSMWLLLKLDPSCDPVWDYLCHKEEHIRGLLQGCMAEHEAELAAVRHRQLEKRDEAERWREMQEETRTQLGKEAVDIFADGGPVESRAQSAEDAAENNPGLYLSLIKKLTAVLIEHMPAFWRTVLLIFNGKLANFPDTSSQALLLSNSWRSASRPGLRSASIGSSSTGSSSSKDGLSTGARGAAGGPYRKRSQMDALVLAMGIVGVYEAKVNEAFGSLERLKGSVYHMRVAVGEVGRLALALSASQESAPAHAVQVLQGVRLELASRLVQHVRGIMREASSVLGAEEDWVPAPATVQPPGVPAYDISMFPTRFQATMTTCLENVNKVLIQLREQRIPTDARGVEALLSMERRLFDSIKLTFYESFLDASETFGKLAHEMQQPSSLEGEGEGEGEGGEGAEDGAPKEEGEEEEEGPVVPPFEGLRSGVPVSSRSQKLLMLLSNAGFMRTVVALQLVHKFHFLWADARTAGSAVGGGMLSDEARRLLDDVESDFQTRETELCDLYIAAKAAHLGTPVIRYFLDGTSWAAAPPVKGLRDSALDLILPLVAVHAEVYAGCSPLVETVIRTLAEGLMDALHQVASEHPVVDLQVLDPNAFCQLSLELSYFELILAPFSSEALIGITSRLREMLLQRTMRSVAMKAAAGGAAGDDSAARSAARRVSREENYGSEEKDVPTPHNDDHLKSIADSLTNDLLPQELRRTRVNVLCFGGTTIDQYLEGMEASSMAHLGPPGGDPHAVPAGVMSPGSALERVPSVSSNSSGASGGRLGTMAYSTSATELPSPAASLHGSGGSFGSGSFAPGPTLTPGSYGQGLGSRAARGAGPMGPGGVVPALGAAPMAGGFAPGYAMPSGGYGLAPGFVPGALGYGPHDGPYPTGGPAYGAAAGHAPGGGSFSGSAGGPVGSRGYGVAAPPAGPEFGDQYRMPPSQLLAASAGVGVSGARARALRQAAAAPQEGPDLASAPDGVPPSLSAPPSRTRATRHAAAASLDATDATPGPDGGPSAFAGRARAARGTMPYPPSPDAVDTGPIPDTAQPPPATRTRSTRPTAPAAAPEAPDGVPHDSVPAGRTRSSRTPAQEGPDSGIRTPRDSGVDAPPSYNRPRVARHSVAGSQDADFGPGADAGPGYQSSTSLRRPRRDQL